jgi:hypothetical protein
LLPSLFSALRRCRLVDQLRLLINSRTIDSLTSQSVYLSTPLGLFTVLRRGVGLLSFLWTSIRPSLSFRFLNQVPIFLL